MLFTNGEIQFVTVLDAQGHTRSFNLSRKKDNVLARHAIDTGATDETILGWCASKTLDWLQDMKVGSLSEEQVESSGDIEFDSEMDFDGEGAIDGSDDDEKEDGDQGGDKDDVDVDPFEEKHEHCSDDDESSGSSRLGTKKGNAGGGRKQHKSSKGTSVAKSKAYESDSSDGGSELGLEDEGIMSSYNDMLKNASHTSVEVVVSHPFVNRKENIVQWKVILGPTGPVWYLKFDFLRDVITMLTKRKGQPLPKAIESLHEISIRKEEHGSESLYRRRKPTPKNMKGGTMSRIAFNIELPLVSQSLFNDRLKEALDLIFNVLKKRTKNNAGELILRWAHNESGQGLYGYLLSQKGGPTKSPEEAARTMNEEIEHVFSNGYTASWHNPLDRLLVDFDIKEFLANEVGCNSWKDLPDSEKGHVFKNYKSRKLPDWDSIRKEPF